MNPTQIRLDFPLLQREIEGKPITYLDSAATSLKPVQVIDAVSRYYSETTANVHRGIHKLSEQASEEFEKSHEVIGKFINAKKEEVFYTKNATESINAVMYSLLTNDFFQSGDEIVLSKMEHHANLVPWQFVEKKGKAKLVFVDLKEDFTLNMDDLQEKISSKTKLVAMAHTSNTVASINDVQKIGKIAHDYNALFLVDAAQSVPHFKVDVKKIKPDFLAFSGHKMLGPTGTGVLYAPKERLEKMEPFLYGGSMIQKVDWHSSTWNKLPDKFEAGTPHIAGAFGLKAAVEYLQKIGIEKIEAHDKELTQYALEKLDCIKEISIHNPKDPRKQGGIILFDTPKMAAHELALALDEIANIAVRSGMHCAEPLVSSINPDGVCRASFYLYNTQEEIDLLAKTLETIFHGFG